MKVLFFTLPNSVTPWWWFDHDIRKKNPDANLVDDDRQAGKTPNRIGVIANAGTNNFNI